MPAAAKKQETKGVAAPEGIKITNIQKFGTIRFLGEPEDGRAPRYVEIKPGETKFVPREIWDRYADRDDVERHNRLNFVVGGIKDGEELKSMTAEKHALEVRARELKAKEQELLAFQEKMENARAQLEAEKEAFAKGH